MVILMGALIVSPGAAGAGSRFFAAAQNDQLNAPVDIPSLSRRGRGERVGVRGENPES